MTKRILLLLLVSLSTVARSADSLPGSWPKISIEAPGMELTQAAPAVLEFSFPNSSITIPLANASKIDRQITVTAVSSRVSFIGLDDDYLGGRLLPELTLKVGMETVPRIEKFHARIGNRVVTKDIIDCGYDPALAALGPDDWPVGPKANQKVCKKQDVLFDTSDTPWVPRWSVSAEYTWHVTVPRSAASHDINLTFRSRPGFAVVPFSDQATYRKCDKAQAPAATLIAFEIPDMKLKLNRRGGKVKSVIASTSSYLDVRCSIRDGERTLIYGRIK